jgi:hypothetical protein
MRPKRKNRGKNVWREKGRMARKNKTGQREIGTHLQGGSEKSPAGSRLKENLARVKDGGGLKSGVYEVDKSIKRINS